MIAGNSEYNFLMEGNNYTDNIIVTSSHKNVATVTLPDAADSRRAKYRITTMAPAKRLSLSPITGNLTPWKWQHIPKAVRLHLI